jgi:hypothetical protein
MLQDALVSGLVAVGMLPVARVDNFQIRALDDGGLPRLE